MRLTLRLISHHRNTPGQQAAVTFDRCGGSIGRSRQADWYLPDPERILSSQHAVVEYREGAYFLADTSTNGLYLNGEPAPLGRGNVARLQAGDTITFGEYIAEVVMEPVAPQQVAAMAPVPVPPIPSAAPVSVAESIDPLDLLIQQLAGAKPMASAQMAFGAHLDAPEPASVPASDVASVNAAAVIPNDWDLDLIGNEAKPPAAPPTFVEPAEMAPVQVMEPDASVPTPPELPQREAIAPLPVAPRVPAVTSTTPGTMEIAAVEAFFRGLGLAPDHVGPDKWVDFMEGAGSALREAIAGMLDALRTRTIIKSEIQAAQTMIRSGENNPLKLSVSVDDAIFNLFAKNVRGFLPPIDAIHEALHDIKAHPVGLMAGTEAVIQAIMEHLNPDQINDANERGSLFEKMTQGGATARWKAYADRHQALTKDIENASHIVFAQRFAAAYEAQMDELKREAMRQYYQQPLFKDA
jgi:type VI secretion system protein